MDREKVAALLESGVLQAYAEGKAIQTRKSLAPSSWVDAHTYSGLVFTSPAAHYRVKPEPKHDWVIEYQENDSWLLLRGKTAEQMKRQFTHRNYRQLVDVLDEEC